MLSMRMVGILLLLFLPVSFEVLADQAASGLPHDRGRPMDGYLPPPGVDKPAPPPPAARLDKPRRARAPSMATAMKLVQAIASGCKQYAIGIAVVDADGAPKLIYVPDGSEGWHGYSAVRKAYTATVFKEPTKELMAKAIRDTALQARIKADPNLMAFSGGRPLTEGGEIVGGVAVSGAEPGGHDDECVLMGLSAVSAER